MSQRLVAYKCLCTISYNMIDKHLQRTDRMQLCSDACLSASYIRHLIRQTTKRCLLCDRLSTAFTHLPEVLLGAIQHALQCTLKACGTIQRIVPAGYPVRCSS